MLGAGAGAGYGYFYVPANGQRVKNTVVFGMIGGFFAHLVIEYV